MANFPVVAHFRALVPVSSVAVFTLDNSKSIGSLVSVAINDLTPWTSRTSPCFTAWSRIAVCVGKLVSSLSWRASISVRTCLSNTAMDNTLPKRSISADSHTSLTATILASALLHPVICIRHNFHVHHP